MTRMFLGAVMLAAAVGCGVGSPPPTPRPSLDALVERAEAGDDTALFELGTRYANGDGVARDNVLAYMWYSLAAERLTAEKRYQAQRMQLLLDGEMFRHQIAEAERLARLWKEAQGGS